MAELVNKEMKRMPIPIFGMEGNDDFFFTVPEGDVYDRTEIEEVLYDHSGAEVIHEPGQGSSGDLGVQVHWHFDYFFPGPNAPLRYIIKIYSKSKFPLDVQGRIFLFEHVDFEGRYKEINNGDPDLTATDEGFFNDKVSSIVILRGNWKIFKDIRFENPYTFNNNPLVLGPGMYSNITAMGIENDDLSSLIAVNDTENHP